jgi:S-adenosylmethionine/arginine decarboxylase-like enzyme
MSLVHNHLIVRAEVANPFVDVDTTKAWMQQLVSDIGMTITTNGGPHCDYISKPGNQGIACIAMIETSHCALHVWDRLTPPIAQLDVYSCAEFDIQIVLDSLNTMSPAHMEHMFLSRQKGFQTIPKKI